MSGFQPKTTKCAKDWNISAQNKEGKYQSTEIILSMTQLREPSGKRMELVIITWCHMFKMLRLCVLHSSVGII